MRTIIFITGEARSGKSFIANQMVSGDKSQAVRLTDFLVPFLSPFNPDCDWIIFDEDINERRHVKVLNGVLRTEVFEHEIAYSSKKGIVKIPNVIVITEKFNSKFFDCRKFSQVIDIHCKMTQPCK